MGGGKSPHGQPLKGGGKIFWEFFRGGKIFFPLHVHDSCECMNEGKFSIYHKL